MLPCTTMEIIEFKCRRGCLRSSGRRLLTIRTLFVSFLRSLVCICKVLVIAFLVILSTLEGVLFGPICTIQCFHCTLYGFYPSLRFLLACYLLLQDPHILTYRNHIHHYIYSRGIWLQDCMSIRCIPSYLIFPWRICERSKIIGPAHVWGMMISDHGLET